MPSNYIGSVYTDRIENESYHGTVTSKKWKDIWDHEIKNHPELFETEILMRFTNRQNATNFEELLQRKLDIIKNDTYINECYANKGFGHFIPHSKESKEKMRISTLGQICSDETKAKMSRSHTGKVKSEEHRESIRKQRTGTTQPDSVKDKISKKKLGCKWVKKGSVSKTIYTTEIEEYLSNGWIFGRNYNKKGK